MIIPKRWRSFAIEKQFDLLPTICFPLVPSPCTFTSAILSHQNPLSTNVFLSVAPCLLPCRTVKCHTIIVCKVDYFLWPNYLHNLARQFPALQSPMAVSVGNEQAGSREHKFMVVDNQDEGLFNFFQSIC